LTCAGNFNTWSKDYTLLIYSTKKKESLDIVQVLKYALGDDIFVCLV